MVNAPRSKDWISVGKTSNRQGGSGTRDGGYHPVEEEMKKKAVKGHYDLYNLVRNMDHVIRTQKDLHPRTRVWKDLLGMVDELREIQRDWAERLPK
jgi:hypothetical protein